MGGISAQIPIKDDQKANEVAMDKVRADKLREVTAGHDGTWIAHPLINGIAREIFDEHMLGANRYHNLRSEVKVAASDLLNTSVPGKVTFEGVRSNVETCLAYTAAWVNGNAPLFNERCCHSRNHPRPALAMGTLCDPYR